jgi:hypothetical protein
MLKADASHKSSGCTPSPRARAITLLSLMPSPSKIGKKSSPADLVVLTTGKATVNREEQEKVFDFCLPISMLRNAPSGLP